MSANVTLSASAAKQINAIIASQAAADLLRIGVVGGGCSGFSYTFALDATVNEDDQLIERDGAKVVIDEASLPFLEGSRPLFIQALKVDAEVLEVSLVVLIDEVAILARCINLGRKKRPFRRKTGICLRF